MARVGRHDAERLASLSGRRLTLQPQREGSEGRTRVALVRRARDDVHVRGIPDHESDATRDLDAAIKARRARDAALTPGQRIEQAAALIKQAQKLAPPDARSTR